MQNLALFCPLPSKELLNKRIITQIRLLPPRWWFRYILRLQDNTSKYVLLANILNDSLFFVIRIPDFSLSLDIIKFFLCILGLKIIIIKNIFTVGYNTIVYPRPGKLIHTNYLQKYNMLTTIII